MLHSSTLGYLPKIAEIGSIRRAAEQLNISSSALNRQILNVERELGLRLFRRTPSGVVPTAAGRQLIRHARDTLGDFQRTLDQITNNTSVVTGEVKIIGISSVVEHVLPKAIINLAMRHEFLDFNLVHAHPEVVVEEVKKGNFDIGIGFLDKRFKDLIIHGTLDAPIGAVVNSKHPLAKESKVSLSHCALYPTAMFTERWLIEPMIESEFHHTGADFRKRIVTNSMILMRDAIIDGVGVGFFTPLCFIEKIRSGEICFIPLNNAETLPSKIVAFGDASSGSSPAMHLTIKCLEEIFVEVQKDIDSVIRQTKSPAGRSTPCILNTDSY